MRLTFGHVEDLGQCKCTRREVFVAEVGRLQPGSQANQGTVASEFRAISMKGLLMARMPPKTCLNLVDAMSMLRRYGLIASGGSNER